MVRSTFGILVAGTALAGCVRDGSDEISSLPTTRKVSVDLSRGKPLRALVGDWKLRDQVYRFLPDGGYLLHYDRLEPAGPGQPPRRSTGHEKGRWSADATTLYLKGERGIDFEIAYSLKGSTLELRYPNSKNPSSFVRANR